MQLVERIQAAREILEQRPRLVPARLRNALQQPGDAVPGKTPVFRAQVLEELLFEVA